MKADSIKTQRLETRLTTEQKATIERATRLSGRSMSDFVTQAAFEAARAVIRDHEKMVLSAKDAEIFANALNNPPTANNALKEAAKNWKQKVQAK